MTNSRPAFVIFTSGLGEDPHDSDVAEVLRVQKNGLVSILFANGDDYRAYPEELEAIT